MHHLQNTFNKGGNAPYNLCLSRKERFYYPFQGDFQDIRESASEKNFYYHLDLSCVQRGHPSFKPGDKAIQESVKANLRDSHKRLLRGTMDIQV